MSSDFIRSRYELPDQTLPGLAIEHHLTDMRELADWIESIGIRTANTRISRYIRYLERCKCETSALGMDVFNDPAEHPFKSPDDRYLYVLREVHELMWIWGGIKDNKPTGLEHKLRIIVGGRDFAALDQDSTSRNIQFELRIASYFCRKGYDVDLSSEKSDITASSPKETFHVECKRIASESQLARRLKEAEKQVIFSLQKCVRPSRRYGIVAMDVTKLAFAHNGLTWGITAEHSRDIIRNKMTAVSRKIHDINPGDLANKHILLTWIQVHIPSLIKHPPQYITLFSSRFLVNPTLGGTRRRAFNRLRAVLETDASGDDRLSSSALTFRKGITVPAGTLLEWDEDLLDLFVDTLTLAERSLDHVVLTLTIQETKHEFYYADLKAVVANLDVEAGDRLRGKKPETMGALLGALLRIRYPYEEYGLVPECISESIEQDSNVTMDGKD